MSLIDIECPDIGLKIFYQDDVIYQFTLNLTDIEENCNKFFICQILQNKLAFFVYTRFGRVGYKGKTNLDCCLKLNNAISEFKYIFENRTGIKWDDRFDDRSDIVKGKYSYLNMKSDNIENIKKITEQMTDINLEPRISDLMNVIFNKNLYGTLSKKYHLNDTKAPLGTITKTQINKAIEILESLTKIIQDKDKIKDKISQKSSEFYSIIPTYSGMGSLPLLDNKTIIKQKYDLLVLLSNMTVHAKVQYMTDIRGKYVSLNCDIKMAPYQETLHIRDYFLNANPNMKVNHIFQVNRHNTSYQKLHNCKLLWHGSRLENFASILTNGLKINPGKNVIKTGSMFGNGLYFANFGKKSSGY